MVPALSMRFAAALSVAALTVLSVSPPARAAATTLKVGYGRVHPITYRDQAGNAAGFAVDVLTEAARRDGLVLSWVPISGSAAGEQMLAAGAIDLMAAAMVTPERQHRFYVSEPWWSEELTLLTRDGATGPVRRLALTPIYSFLAKKAYPDAVLFPGLSLEDNVSAVCSGKVDALLLTHGEMHAIALNRPPACAAVPLASGDTNVVLKLAVISRRETKPVAQRLRGRIDEMAADGTLTRLAGKNPPISTSAAVDLASTVRDRAQQRLWLIAVLLLLPIAIWAGVYQLRRWRYTASGDVPGVMPSPARRVLFAAVIMFVAVGIRYLLRPMVGYGIPFLFQSFAVAFAAQYGGLVSGVLATALSIALSGFVFPQPLIWGMFPARPSEGLGLVVFVLLNLSLSFFGERFITAKRQRLEAERDHEVERQHVAELQRAEKELRESESRLKAVVGNLAEGLIVVDPQGNTLVWNPEALRLHGYDGSEGEIAHLARLREVYELRTLDGQIVPFDDWPVRRILRGESFRGYELALRNLPGAWERIFSYNGVLVRDSAGAASMGLLTISDITERKRAEQERAGEKARLEAVLDSVAEPIFVCAADGTVLQTNAAFRAAFPVHGTLGDYRPGQEVRTLDGELVPPELWPVSRLLRGETLRNLEFRVHRPGAPIMILSYSGNPVRDERGNITHVVLTIRDVTEQKVLRGFLPTCAYCKNIRDPNGEWHQLEQYITARSQARFSHTICPDCLKRYSEPDIPGEGTA